MIKLGDETLEKAVHKISELGQELAKWESLYEKYNSEMKYHRDMEYLKLMNDKMTQKEREAIANTQQKVIDYIDLIAEAKKNT